MHALKIFALKATVFAVGVSALAAPALADEKQWHNVKNMTLSTNNNVAQVTVRNIAGNHHINSLNLAIQGHTIPVSVGGAVECLGITSENLTWRHGAYLQEGAFGIGRTSLLMSQGIPYSGDIDRTGHLDAHGFQMPVALLNNPQIAVDPVALVLAAADKAPNKVQYLRQDQVIMAEIPIRWESTCAEYSRQKILKKTITEAYEPVSYLTKNVALKIVYKGDPQLFGLNAQLGQAGQQPGGFQAAPSSLKITAMTFQPNMPHHVGACPATTRIRVFFQGQGKGALRIRINDSGKTIHTSPQIAFDAQNGKQHYDFEIATPKASKADLNKTVAHNLQAYFRGKDEQAQTWPSQYQPMDTALWKHRCTPQVNPGLVGGAGGYSGGIQQGGPQQGGQAKPGVTPSATTILPKRAVPVDPTPAKPKRAQ
ncbi:MAG: hypothetical protein Tsb0032_25120 [Kiloniellaceae bacterium]